MELFRRHLRAVIIFPVAIVILALVMVLLVTLFPGPVRIWWALNLTLIPAFFAIVIIVLTLSFYRRADARRKAEWALLVPVLAASMTLAFYWINVFSPLLSLPDYRTTTALSVASTVANCVFLVGICILGAALAGVVMDRPSKGTRSPRVLHEIVAVATLIFFSQVARTAAWQIADSMGWGFGTTLAGLTQKMITQYGFILVGVLMAWLLLALPFWPKADALGRGRWMALLTSWVALDEWLRGFGDLAFFYPEDWDWDPEDWYWGVFFGAVAGLLAVLYSRLVVARLWRRAFEVPRVQ